ncbi:MAG TPA: hypothetical protein VIJ61_18560 [Thermoanaerobaculia bacterium]
MKKERSRSYPVLDLEAAYEILIGRLTALGSSRRDREALAEALGYSSAGGGMAARKISALVQYGMIDYRDGLYELSLRGHRLQGSEAGSEERLSSLQGTLEKPALFRSILSRYRPVGRIPGDLARVLTEQYGITASASEEAEAVFIRSAVFAGVLDAEGRFREAQQSPSPAERAPISPLQPQAEVARKPPFPFPVSEGRSVELVFPPDMTVNDLKILERRLQREIEDGTLWDYLSLKKPIANPTQSSAEEQAPAGTDNVVPIRPLRES